MANLSQKARNSVSLQAEMFRLAECRYGLSTAVLSRTREIAKSTLDGWASGQTQMPAWALGELSLPDELTSLVLDPYSKHVGTDEGAKTNWDILAAEAAGLVADVCTARADGQIDHVESASLKERTRKLIAEAHGAVSEG